MENKIIENEVNINATSAPSAPATSAPTKYLKVFRKDSKFKDEKGNLKYWYTATKSNGNSVNLKFMCDVENEGKAFVIYDIIGQRKTKEVEVGDEKYINETYYIKQCKFADVPDEELEV